ncbi:MAG: hypothetical protein GXO61_04600 [Epsilonproteobacteria bacterium]|nr:hypothetical protein [Campylobacterota bacterium]
MERFSNFFYRWLYQHYYSSPREIGKKGDFFTAVSVTPLFGGTIANYIFKQIEVGKFPSNGYIFEIGAHKGYLLADIVQFLYTFNPSLIKSLKFAIIEPFEPLQKLQQTYFKESFKDEVTLLHFKDLKEVKVDYAFIVANEIFDAFPCELIYKDKMAYVKDFKIAWQKADEDILAKAKRFNQVKGEVALGYEQFAKKMKEAFEVAEFVTFDYGDLEVRNDFSIRIYFKHQVFPLFEPNLDLKALFGRSDITYDVNFSHLIEAFQENGWEKEGYKTQAVALVDFGIMELLEKIMNLRGFEIYKQELEKVKILISPSLMGERFKMVHFSKGKG